MAADKSRALRVILLGGLIAGTLDISYACIFGYIRRRTSPVVILQIGRQRRSGEECF
jgi:hypothetical protein